MHADCVPPVTSPWWSGAQRDGRPGRHSGSAEVSALTLGQADRCASGAWCPGAFAGVQSIVLKAAPREQQRPDDAAREQHALHRSRRHLSDRPEIPLAKHRAHPVEPEAGAGEAP